MIGGARKKGFTIVEVILVLAIAGLIFMMVFMAVPALQRNTRDAKRREDILLMVEAIKDYQRNNRGALPSGSDWAWRDFRDKYLGGNFADPSGVDYILTPISCIANSGEDCSNDLISFMSSGSYQNSGYKNTIAIILRATCDGPKAKRSSNPRKVALLYRLEGGGVFCANT